MSTVLALLSSLLWGTSDFLGGSASRRMPVLTVVAVTEALGALGVLVVAVAVGGFGAPTGYIGWALLGSVFGMGGLTAFYRALATGTMGVVAPIAALGVVVPVAVGVAAGDRPSAAQDVGLVVAIVGVVLASGPEVRAATDRARAARPLLLAAVAAVGFGVVFVALDHGARTSTVMTLLVMRSGSIVIVLVAARLVHQPVRAPTRELPVLAVIAASDVGANATFAAATQRGLLSLVAVLSSLYPAVTVLLAREVHHERLGRVQLGGVLGALAGVVLISSGGGA